MTRREFVRVLPAAALMQACSTEAPPSPAPAESGAEPLRIVDPHVHVWKNDRRFPWPKELREPPKEDALPETLLDLMRANGVAHTVLVHVIHYRWDCRYTAAVMKQYPHEFQGVCRVDPESPSAPDDLTKWVEDYGFQGVRLSPGTDARGDWIAGPLMDPLWKRTRALGVPMLILTRPERLPDVSKLVDRFQDVDVCIDHMADCPIDAPDQLEKLLSLARFPRVYVKISHTWSLSKQEYPYRDTWDQVKKVYDAFGPQRTMWGTDWPLVERHCGYAKALALVRDEMDFFNQEDKRWILGKTVERLWPFKPAEATA